MAQVEKIARGEGTAATATSHGEQARPRRRRRHSRHRAHDRDLRPVDRAERDRLELRHGVRRARRVSSSARQRAGGRCDRGEAAGRLLPRSAGGVGRRVRRAGRRWPGQRRRVQSHGPRRRRAGPRCAAGGGRRPGGQRQRAAGTGRPVQRVPRPDAADVRRCRSRAVQGDGRAAQRSVPHAAALSGRLLHQRLQPVRPHLAGQSAGRSAVSA